MPALTGSDVAPAGHINASFSLRAGRVSVTHLVRRKLAFRIRVVRIRQQIVAEFARRYRHRLTATADNAGYEMYRGAALATQACIDRRSQAFPTKVLRRSNSISMSSVNFNSVMFVFASSRDLSRLGARDNVCNSKRLQWRARRKKRELINCVAASFCKQICHEWRTVAALARSHAEPSMALNRTNRL